MIGELRALRAAVKDAAPLIHCLTNHITINDCANALLSVGARPVMAEHPGETREITRCAQALMVNLGNITDERMRSMLLSGRQAKEGGLPCVIDLAGVAASTLRLDFARKFIAECNPCLIKGNASEMLSLLQGRPRGGGVDAIAEDKSLPLTALADAAARLSERHGTAVLISGAADIIVRPPALVAVENGDPLLAAITGTGCVQGALAAAFVSCGDVFAGAVLAAALLSVCAEEAARKAKSPGSFKTALFDRLYDLPDRVFAAQVRIRGLEDEIF
ncbi:MAG: hydroxyethylthiazole kinase [Acidaminococcales bacterium]|jgi:hydroxyethylthiazole kinase|nr:hydroxyethylthiazole kinase [Acidaminococcales bacterium]